jgi:outer membrane lipoprotein-sorting protein
MVIARVCAALLVSALLALPVTRALAQGVEALLPAAAPTAYRGRKVVIDFTHGRPQVTSMSVQCQPDGRERREMHATRGLLVVDGESTWQYLPERGVVLKRPARVEGGEVLRPEQLRRALASYLVRVLSSERVAGRPSRTVEFTPRQAGTRPRRLVWFDEETGLILRTEVYGTDRRLRWLSVFEDLEYRPALDAETFKMLVPPGVRVVESGDEPCLEPAAAERLAGLPVALPDYIPEGFERQCIRARRRSGYGEIQVVFGDGLSLLSLFASTSFREPSADATSATPVEVGHGTGRWHDLGLVTGISWRTPWAHLALLGELSRDELHKIAKSVRGVSAELSTSHQHP